MNRSLFAGALAIALVATVALACTSVRNPTTPNLKPNANAEANAEAKAEHLTLLFAADLHGQMEPHPELFWNGDEERTKEAGGFARLAAAISDIRAERGDRVFALDGGDTLQGSGVAALTEGAAIIEPLNAIGFDLGIPGNWEVVYGAEVLRQRVSEIEHPLIAANVRDAETNERVFAPYAIRKLGNVRVAFIGYTDPDVPIRQPPAYSKGLRYTGEEELPPLIREVREEHEADLVILVSHVGLTKAVAMTERLSGIDLHLSSDTHERTYEPIERNGVWIVEPGAFGSFLGRLDLWVKDGRIVEKRWELMELTADRFREDPQVVEVVARAMEPHREVLETPVGTIGNELARYSVIEANLDNVLADALRDATGTDIALSNGFRFGTPIPPGEVTERDLWNFFPIVTPLKTGWVTGKQLRDFWEQELENVFSPVAENRFGGWLPRPSGMTMRFESSAPKGQRVREIRVGGELLDDDRLYSVTSCEREGDTPDSLCRMRGAKDTQLLDFDAHEAVRRYLAKHPNVMGEMEGRVIGIDLPRVLRTQN